MDIHYHEYRHILSYQSYIKKKKIGNLPFAYKGYTKYLYELYGDGISYCQFASYYKELGYVFIKRKTSYDRSKKDFKRYGDYNRYIVSL